MQLKKWLFLGVLSLFSGYCFAETGVIKIQTGTRFYCPEYALPASIDIHLYPDCQRFITFPSTIRITNKAHQAATGSITFFEPPPMNAFITVNFAFDEQGNFQYEKVNCETENPSRLPCIWDRNQKLLRIGK